MWGADRPPGNLPPATFGGIDIVVLPGFTSQVVAQYLTVCGSRVPDLSGKALVPGDAVIYERPDGTADTTATVLAVRGGGRYLIQLDPIRPGSWHEDRYLRAALDHEAELLPQLAGNPADLQEPFDVDGSCLYLLEPEKDAEK